MNIMKKAMTLIISLLLTTALLSGCAEQNTPVSGTSAVISIRADLPDSGFSGTAEEFIRGEGITEWLSQRMELTQISRPLRSSTKDFNKAVMRSLLTAENSNTVCSPLNIYIALCLTSEMAEGATQEQILALLGADSIETARENANALWKSNYVDIPLLQSRLANSVWLRDDPKEAQVYNEDLLNRIADKYYADVFSGEMGSEEMNSAIREWTDEATGSLLKEYTSEIETDPYTLMELVSTIYYKGMWSTPFNASQNETRTFHGKSGDKDCEMMTASGSDMYYWGEDFAAIALPVTESGMMYFFLPDEGKSPADVFENPQFMDLLTSDYGYYTDSKYLIVNKVIPKFRTSSKLDIRDAMRSLGVTDAFDQDMADFTPLKGKGYPYENPYIYKIDHASMVEIDEEGVTGAAFTDIGLADAGMPPEEQVDFVLDRPFVFVITSNDGSVLFAGTVYDIN